jgi:hypothetical protein
MHGSEVRALSLGHPLLDDYLAFVGARARVNTWLATAYDLKVFFTVVGKEPTQVATSDVFAFLKAQRAPRLGERVVRLEDGEAGLAARTIARRLSSVSGLFAYLAARGDVGVARNPRAGRGAAGAHSAHPAPGAVPDRGGCSVQGAADPPGPGDGAGDVAGRVAPLRGARAASG